VFREPRLIRQSPVLPASREEIGGLLTFDGTALLERTIPPIERRN
jgi:hypothetical protein